MTGPDRPGDVAQARDVDTWQRRDREERIADQARRDAERIFIVTVANARTGARVVHNSRDEGGWYHTEDGSFLMLSEDVDRVLAAWRGAGEASELPTFTISGREFREAQARAVQERGAKP